MYFIYIKIQNEKNAKLKNTKHIKKFDKRL